MVKVEIRRKGDARPILERISKAISGPTQVKVGFISGEAPSDVLMRAIWAEFGTTKQPERPFFRNAMKANRDSYGNLAKAGAQSILTGDGDMRGVLSKMGIKAQGDVQREMPGTPPPNAPSTIAQKGSSTTLVDSGQTRQSISWKIDE